MAVITRFPPSPTGYLHIGGARTALFNWLFARQSGGRFILRIEDTDAVRSTQEMTDAILQSMEWLGLNWDESPYFQSQRTEIYNQYIDKLLKSGHAYFCSCSPEEVEAMREQARKEGKNPMYNGHCRELGFSNQPGAVVRFKALRTGKTIFEDIVKGPIVIDNSLLDDFILRRADGTPTYQVAVVIDDALMGVTHVLRGDDHQSNTPKQIQLYQALGFPVPLFGHVPMILGPDKKKMSKRHGATSVMVYKEMGYLPEALVNYLVRLGWSHGDDEIFSMPELLEKFSIKNLGKSPAVFDTEKLNWLNAHYIKEAAPAKLAPLLAEHVSALGIAQPDMAMLEKIIPLLQPRAVTLVEMAEKSLFFLLADNKLEYDSKAVQKFLTPENKQRLQQITDILAAVEPFSIAGMEDAMREYIEKENIKFKVIAQPIRVALTGTTISPGLFEIMEVLGRDKTLKRLIRAVQEQ